MTALSVNYTAPNGPYSAKYGDATVAINQAFNAWMAHFDAPQGAVTINVSFVTQPIGFVASAGPSGVVTVGVFGSKSVNMSGFAAEIATGAPLSATTRSAALYVDPTWFRTYFADPAANTGEIQRVLQHEVGHMLGIIGYTYTGNAGPVVSPYYTTEFDNYLRFTATAESFVGPNAIAAYGGPVNMDPVTVDHPYVPGRVSLMSYQDQAKTIQPLDVAMLRDTGVPILSDQEVQEHAATRLYQAALGRAPDAAGLLQQSRALLAGTSLGTLANGFINSVEFALRYGVNPSAKTFVNAMYQNVLHRAADAAGVQVWTQALEGGLSQADALASFSNSAENRNALNVNPNLSYSETAEAQTERMYDAAFGRAPDAVGFGNWSRALLNGATLQQEALEFISSREFTNRYGAAPSNTALVDALYQNTLHRAADASGRTHWVDVLNQGMSRADLLVAFSESSEHVNNVIKQDTATSGSSYLADPSAHLGSIPVLPGRLIG